MTVSPHDERQLNDIPQKCCKKIYVYPVCVTFIICEI